MSDATSPVPLAPSSGHHHHHHHHHHGRNHDHTTDLATANKQHYDNTVDQYEAMPRVKERAKRYNLAFFGGEISDARVLKYRVVIAMREAVSLYKESSTALEFACGPGVVCNEVLPYVKEIVGVDISSAAVERCNRRLKEAGANENCFAIEANLLSDRGTLAGKQFNLVYCTSAYHHFEDPEEITRVLATFLKPDGALIIVDNLAKGDPEEEVSEEHRAYVTRFGFNEDDIKGMFASAGLEFVSFAEVPRDEQDNDIFIAKGILKA